MKKAVVFALTAVMLAGLLSGCAFGTSLEDIAGTWERTVDDTEEQALVLLENIDFYPEEIACADLTSLDYIHTVEFTTDGVYRFCVEAEGTRFCVKEFFRGVFEALYENRAGLGAAYGTDFTPMTMEEFCLFYAELYGCGDYEELLELLAENAYDYTTFDTPLEQGTCRMSGGMLYCIIDGETLEESMGFELEENSLTLKFADTAMVFYRA